MKKITLCTLFVACLVGAGAQKSKKEASSFYLFDKNWQPCQQDEAEYFARFDKLADTMYQWRYYHFTGPLMSVQTFRDEDGTVPNGYFAWYDMNGLIDSSGYSINGKKNRSWMYYTDSLTLWKTEEYDNGRPVSSKDLATLQLEKKMRDTMALEPGEREAVFKGGDEAFIKYLEKNYEYPDRAVSLHKHGMVQIMFVVDIAGIPTDFQVKKSIEYSLDEEAIRLIRESPAWEPAVQGNRKVRAYRVQPIIFDSE